MHSTFDVMNCEIFLFCSLSLWNFVSSGSLMIFDRIWCRTYNIWSNKFCCEFFSNLILRCMNISLDISSVKSIQICSSFYKKLTRLTDNSSSPCNALPYKLLIYDSLIATMGTDSDAWESSCGYLLSPIGVSGILSSTSGYFSSSSFFCASNAGSSGNCAFNRLQAISNLLSLCSK